VFNYLTSFYENHNIGVFDEKTKVLAMKFLKKGAKLNDSESIKKLGDLYMKGLYLKKDTLIGKALLYRAKKDELLNESTR
jgi:TPR repeat protein